MKRTFCVVLALLMMFSCMFTIAYASEGGGQSLSDIISGNGTVDNNSSAQGSSGNQSQQSSVKDSKDSFVEMMKDASDISDPMPEIDPIITGIKTVASYVIQIVCYAVTILLVLRVVLDLSYIGLPFCRAFLANGYQGNPQAGAGGAANSLMGNQMGGMGSPMGGMGMGGYGMGSMGGYGMNRMGAMNSMNAMNSMGGAPTVANQRGTTIGRIQWVSNAALNAVAAESTVGPDGKAVSPFKLYCKDMIIILVLTPILLTLAVTGTLTNFGFMLGDLLIDAISRIGDMM